MTHTQPRLDLESALAALPRAPASTQEDVGLDGPAAQTQRETGAKLRSVDGRLIVVANRLPVHQVRRAGEVSWERSPGGLVSALWPLLEGGRGTWVGWSGAYGEPRLPSTSGGLILEHVPLSRPEVEHFYTGFANTILWPLYHDAVRWPEFERRWWKPYVDVNRRFAAAAARAAQSVNPAEPAPLIWVHDYQLQLVPQFLRETLPHARIGFFLHIPFPPGELFAQLPWREQILRGLLEADVVGFQTRSGVRNFLEVVERYLGLHAKDGELVVQGRRVQVGSYPISIDSRQVTALSKQASVAKRAAEIRAKFSDRRIILGVDRLDYTKGIDRRLTAFELLLERNPQWREQLVLVQIAVPSRESVPEYAEMRKRIEGQVGHINGRFGEAGRAPVHYLYRNLPFAELAAWYRATDVMAVTPLRDGMNLVAKEFVATRSDLNGVLVLSEFAGAAREMVQAIEVNPHDVEALAEALAKALNMPAAERRERLLAMQRLLRRRDVHAWAERFLRDLQMSSGVERLAATGEVLE